MMLEAKKQKKYYYNDINTYTYLLKEYICHKLFKNAKSNNTKISIVSCTSLPRITLIDYLNRITFYTQKSRINVNDILIMVLILIDKINNDGFKYNIYITYKSCHIILFTTFNLILSMYDDFSVKEKFYADLSGMTIKELFDNKIALLKCLNYNIFIHHKIFDSYKKDIYDILDNM